MTVADQSEAAVIAALERNASWSCGSVGYLVSTTWWNAWVQYSGYSGPSAESASTLMQLSGGGSPRPGPISNTDLLPPGHTVDQKPLLPGSEATPRAEDVPLRPDLVEQQDFIVVSEASWQRLHSWYSGGPGIARRVVADPAPGPSGCSGVARWTRVALYPLRFEVSYKEAKEGAQERTAVVAIEPEASLSALKTRSCAALGVPEEEVVLWDYSGGAAVRSLETAQPGEEAQDEPRATSSTGTAAANATGTAAGTAAGPKALEAGEPAADGPDSISAAAAAAGSDVPIAVEPPPGPSSSAAGAGVAVPDGVCNGGGSSLMEVDGIAPAAAATKLAAGAGTAGSEAAAAAGKAVGYMGRSLRDVALLDGQLLRLRRKDAPNSDSDDDDACGSDNDTGAPVTGRKAKAAKQAAATGTDTPPMSAAQAAAAAALKRAAASAATTPASRKDTGIKAALGRASSGGGGGGATFGSNNTGLVKRASTWDDNVVPREGQLPGLAGLSNLGNTCFMNSSLQCLAHAVPLMSAFLGGAYLQDLNRTNPLGMKGELAEAFGALMGQLWRGGVSSVTPRAFKAKIGRFAPQFSGYAQHDSQEFLAFLLDGLHEDTNRIKNKPYIEEKDQPGRPDEEVAAEAWANYRARNNSLVVDHFQGLFKSTVDCPQCGFNSVKFDPFMYLSLPLPESRRRVVEAVLVAADGSLPPARMALELAAGATLGDLVRAAARLAELPAEVQAAPESHLLPARPLRPSPSAAYDEVVLLPDCRMRVADALDAGGGGGGGGGGGYNLRSSAAHNADPGLVLYYYPDASRGPRAEGLAPVILHFKRPDTAKRFSWSRDSSVWCGAPLVLYMEADRPPYDPDQVVRTDPSSTSNNNSTGGGGSSSYGSSTRAEYIITGECPLAAAVRTALRPIQKAQQVMPGEEPSAAATQLQTQDAGASAAAGAGADGVVDPPADAAGPMEEDAPATGAPGAAPGDTEIVDAAAVAAEASAAPAADAAADVLAAAAAAVVGAAAAAAAQGEGDDIRPHTPVHDLDPEITASAAPSGRPSRTSSCGVGAAGGGSGDSNGGELMEGLEPLVALAAVAAAGGGGGGDASMPGTPHRSTAPAAMEEEDAAAAPSTLPAVMYAGAPPEADAAAAGGGLLGPPAAQPFDMWAAQDATVTAATSTAAAAAAAPSTSSPTASPDPGCTFVLKLCNKGDSALWGGVYEKDIEKEHHREFLLLFTSASSTAPPPATSTASAATPTSPAPIPTYSPALLDQPAEHPTLRQHRQRAAAGPQPVSLHDCMTTFLHPERLAESDAWYCPRCKSHVCADKKLDLWSLPEVLVVHLKRFCYTRYSRNKLDTRVDFPLHGLDLGPYLMRPQPQDAPPLYDLFAVSNHYGSMGGGHYTAYAKLPSPPPPMPRSYQAPAAAVGAGRQAEGAGVRGEQQQQQQPLEAGDVPIADGVAATAEVEERGVNGTAETAEEEQQQHGVPMDRWYCFDDSHVSQVDPQAVRSSAAYVLFYRRRAQAAADPPQLEGLLERLRQQREAAAREEEQAAEQAQGAAAAGVMADGPVVRHGSGSPGYGSDRQIQDQDQDQDQDRDTGKARGGGMVSLAAAAAAAKASRRKDAKKGGGNEDGEAAEELLQVQERSAGFTAGGSSLGGFNRRSGSGAGAGTADDDLYGSSNLPIAAPSSPMPVSAGVNAAGAAALDDANIAGAGESPTNAGAATGLYESLLPYAAASPVGSAGAGAGGADGTGRYDMEDYDAFVVAAGVSPSGDGAPQPPGSPQPGSPDMNSRHLSDLYGDVEAMEVVRARDSGSDVGGLEHVEEMRSSDGGAGGGAMLGRLLGEGGQVQDASGQEGGAWSGWQDSGEGAKWN